MELGWVDGAVKLGLPSFLCLVLVGYLIKTQGDSFRDVADALKTLAVSVAASASQREKTENKMVEQLIAQTIWLQMLAQKDPNYKELREIVDKRVHEVVAEDREESEKTKVE